MCQILLSNLDLKEAEKPQSQQSPNFHSWHKKYFQLPCLEDGAIRWVRLTCACTRNTWCWDLGQAHCSSNCSNPPGSLLAHSWSGQVGFYNVCKDLGREGWDRQRKTHRRERPLVAFMPFMPVAPWDLVQEFFNWHFQEHVRACWANLPYTKPDTWLTFAPFPPFISVT